MTATYPNSITKPHKMTEMNPKFRSRAISNDLYFAEMSLILSLKTRITTELTANVQMAVIRKAHARLIC